MEFNDYMQLVSVIQRRWWIIIAAIVLTAGSAVGFSRLKHTEYTSTAEIIIEPARPDWGLAQSAKMLLRTYMTTADSNQWAEQVIATLQLPMTPEELRAQAHFAAQDDRMVIQLEIEAYDGDIANDIAREWATLFIQWRDQQNQLQRKEDRVFAYLRDQPRYRQSWPPSTRILLAAGAVFGLVIAASLIFFLEWVDAGLIHSPRDLERQLGLTVVGAIPSGTSGK